MPRKEINETTTKQQLFLKNPDWPEANQLVIYKCSPQVEPGTTRITELKFNEWDLRILSKASALTTGHMAFL